MTRTELLEHLKDFTLAVTKDIILPVAQQKEDKTPPLPRAPEVYKMRLPDSNAAKKKAPYIIHQVLNGKDIQEPGTFPIGDTVVRTIFAVYHRDEQEGGLALLEVMERMRIAFLVQQVIGKQFKLNLQAGLETLAYPDGSAPYFGGEMISVWRMPPIERKVLYGKEGYSWIKQPDPGRGCDQPCDGRFPGGIVPGPGGKD